MVKLLLGLVGAEVSFVVRRATTTALLFVLGALLVGGALLFVMVAVFIALAEAYGPLRAAVIVAAALFGVGGLVLVVAYGRLRARQRRSAVSPLAAFGTATNQPIGPQPPPLAARTVVGIAAVAAIAGLILGRRI